MINEKKVSVIIPTYKRAELLSKCIKSILEQTYSNVEVIVVDDNDPKTNWRKNTESILDDFKEDSRVIYIKHEKNKNGSAARNTGFKVSTGEYICYLDDDDIFLKNKIMTWVLVAVIILKREKIIFYRIKLIIQRIYFFLMIHLRQVE